MDPITMKKQVRSAGRWLFAAALLAVPLAGCGGEVEGDPSEESTSVDGIDTTLDLDPLAATSCTQIASLAASAMPTKTFGNSCWAECWNLWGNGYIEQTVTFPASGTYRFVVKAKGTKALNIWPNMELRIDQQRVASAFVTSTTPADYSFTVTVSAGAHRVAIAYTNNYDNQYEQRNLLVHTVTIERCATTEPPPQPGQLQVAIDQNTRSKNTVFPYGVPESWDWYAGKISKYAGPPPGFTAMTGWAVVYPQKFVPNYVNNNARLEVRGFKAYGHRRGGGWVLLQQQALHVIEGAQFTANLTRAVPWTKTVLPDRTVQIGLPPLDWMIHYWVNPRGTYADGSLDGSFVRVEMRVTDANVNMVGQVAVDWWRDAGAPFLADFSNNPTAGASNWVKLTGSWAPLYYYSMTDAQLLADPPPLD